MPDIWTVYGIFGVALWLLVTADLGCTILRVEGPGPLTKRLTSAGWSILQHGRKRGVFSNRLMSYAAPPMLLLILAMWTGLTWVAWSLIFMGSSGALVVSETGRAVPALERIQFAGQTLATIGLPEIEGGGFFWEVLVTLCGLNGFFILTLSVAYLLPLYEAAVSSRSVALMIAGLGDTPEEILRGKWDEAAFQTELMEIARRLFKQSVDQRAYPVLHFFQARVGEMSLCVRLCAIDEAVTMLEFGAREPDRLPRSVYHSWRRAVGEYLCALSHLSLAGTFSPPPVRPLGGLADLGVGVVSEERYLEAMATQDSHRAGLRGLVESQGWTWGNRPMTQGPDENSPGRKVCER